MRRSNYSKIFFTLMFIFILLSLYSSITFNVDTLHSFWWLTSTHGYKTFVLVTHQYSRLQNIPVRVSYSFCNIVQSERCILVKGFLSKATQLIFKSYMTVNPDKYTYVELVLPSCMSFGSSTFSTFSTITVDLFN